MAAKCLKHLNPSNALANGVHACAAQEAVAAKDAELAAGRSALAALQERAHGLELANYSLGLHLRQATSSAAAGGFGGGPRPPDVF